MRTLVVIGFAILLGACSEAPLNVIYPHDQCKRLSLIDSDTKMPVLGAEDMVRLPGGSLLIAAYDRRTKEVNRAPPEGGLYILPPRVLSQDVVDVDSLFSEMIGGLRPHGIDVFKAEDNALQVGFINRSHYSDNALGQSGAELFTFELTPYGPGHLRKIPNLACRANDLVFHQPLSTDNASSNSTPVTNREKSLFVSVDRTHCSGFSAYFENMTGRKGGMVHQTKTPADNTEWQSALSNLAFANGIGIRYKHRPFDVDDNFLAIAETRANQIRYVPPDNGREPVKLPGSPDNLTVGATGIILAALHPSLMKLAFYRYKWPFFNKAPSRVVKVTGDEVLVLFDDPTGDLFSAASVAVQTAGKLVIGSVGDAGLLVCGTEKVS